VTILGQGADGLLVREVRDGPFVRVDPVLDTVFGANLGGSVAIGPRFGIAASLPIWFGATGASGSAPGLGDLELWAPVILLDEQQERRRYTVSVVPTVSLPTGANARYLGDPFGGGALVSGAAGFGPLAVSLDAGMTATLATGDADWAGGLRARFAGSVGVVPTESFGLHAEVRGTAPFAGDVVSVPTEGLLTARARPASRFWLTGGIGAAITRGPGAATPRFFFGTTIGLDREEEDTPQIQTTARGEVQELHVVDERRFPIEGAQVELGRYVLSTDRDGFVDIPLKAWRKAEVVPIEHPMYEVFDLRALEEEASFWEIQLDRRPIPVAVSVVGPEGDPLDTAKVRMANVAEPNAFEPEVEVDAVGVHRWTLPPDTTWVATITAEKMGGQARVVSIPAQRIEPIRVDVVLGFAEDPTTKLTVTVVDGTGVPVEDAAVAVDDRDFGTTGPGGVLEVRGLPREDHVVTVRSSTYGEAVVRGVEIGDDTEVTAALSWPAGAVVARVVDDRGEPLDATVSLRGPVPLPERRLGSDGQQLFILRPGDWVVRFSSPGTAPQERTLVVSDVPGILRELDVTLQPLPEEGNGELVVQVVDEAGNRLADVAVKLDGQDVGTTSADGTLTLLGVAPGTRSVSASAEGLASGATEVELAEGRQIATVTLDALDGVVTIETGIEGRPAAMDVSVRPVADEGAGPIASVDTGADGVERVVLPPGEWVVRGETADGRQAERTVVVPERGSDAAPLTVSLQLLDGDAVVAVEVRDPEGGTIDGAAVSVRGVPVGTTRSGVLTLNDVRPGSAEIRVVPPTDQGSVSPTTSTVELVDGGTVRITLEAPDAAVADAGPVDVPVSIAVPAPPEGFPPPAPVETRIRLKDDSGASVVASVMDGQVLPLVPGVYDGVAEADGYAPVPVHVEVDPTTNSVLSFELSPATSDAPLVFTLEDRDGNPVSGAVVYDDAKAIAKSGPGGVVTIEAPDRPKRGDLRLDPGDGYAERSIPVGSAPGGQFVLEYVEQTVQVSVVDPSGAPVAGASVRIDGLEDGPRVIVTDASGVATAKLPPGSFTFSLQQGGDGVFEAAFTALTVAPGEAPEQVSLQIDSVETTVGTAEGVDVLVLAQPVLFDLGKAAIRPENEALLDDVGRLLRADRSLALVEVAGHTDDIGGVEYNQGLSERRAEAVRRALVERGVEPERLLRRGYGLSRPVSAGTDDASRQRNRRVELVVLEKE
jgi:outer membrane protein OmpA-like peptidoglycan-associated protein